MTCPSTPMESVCTACALAGLERCPFMSWEARQVLERRYQGTENMPGDRPGLGFRLNERALFQLRWP